MPKDKGKDKFRRALTPYGIPLPGVQTGNLSGKLIVIEGPDAVGRSTQVARLRLWLEQEGHAVLDTGMARSALAGKGISRAKEGNTLGPVTMTLYYVTDLADRLENEIIPALRAGFIVLTDRYIFSIMARAISRGEDPEWIEKVCGFGLVPHAIYYMRAKVKDLVSRVVLGRGAFDYWESGMDSHFGRDMYASFIKYQTRLILTLEGMAKRYNFIDIDARQTPDAIFSDLQRRIVSLELGKVNGAPSPREEHTLMELYIFRHGIAEVGHAGRSDSERELTDDGKKKTAVVVKNARRAGMAPSLILSSPYVRALQTARIAADELDYKGSIVQIEALIPHHTPETVWKELREYRDEAAILLAGHEPLLGHLVAYLLATPALRVEMKKSAMVRVDVHTVRPTPHGILRWMITPKIAG